MRLFRIILTITFFLITQFQLLAQTQYNDRNKFEVKQLQEDFKVLRKVLEEVHPGLYRYSSKKIVDSLFNSSYNQVITPMTEIEFYRIINKMVTSIRDEHTFALPSKAWWDSKIGQTVYYNSINSGNALLFPFFIKILDNRLYIDNNLSDDLSLNRGDEILQINGQTAKEVLETLLPSIHTNGYIETFKKRNLEQFSMHQTYNRFIVHYALFIGMPDTFHLRVKRYGSNQIEAVNITALTSKTIYQHYWRRYSTLNDPKKHRENPSEFNLLNDSTAYLRLSDFHDYAWLKYNYSTSTEFKSIAHILHKKSIKNLIIDLRNNEGGDLGIGMKLMPYITTGTFQPYQYHEVNNYRFPELKAYFEDSTAFPNYPDELFIAQKNGTFRSNPQYKTEKWSRPMQPDSNNYKNNLYVLINGATGSAASIFATLIRVNRKDAVFVGEESGGDMEGPVSGSGTDITLPNTKTRVDIPWIKRAVNLNGYEQTKGHGIQPDYGITPSVKDFTNNVDTELGFTISLIENRKK
ncbi:MAG: hypothetical protein KF862_14755 [Chitinophagaceae bacterium]|nr:hypothetical protein [Chitinophagaceae bacterium]